MKPFNNFQRAKELTSNWPAWKRDYQLTKNSECRQEPSKSEEKILQNDGPNKVEFSHCKGV